MKEKRKNLEYNNRIKNLEKMMLVMNNKDTIVIPKTTAWFEFYDQKGDNVVKLRESNFYINDFIGIRDLDEKGKIVFVSLPGRHTIFEDKDILNHFAPFLK